MLLNIDNKEIEKISMKFNVWLKKYQKIWKNLKFDEGKKYLNSIYDKLTVKSIDGTIIWKVQKFSSSIFQSSLLKECHSKNPITIYIGFVEPVSGYIPHKKAICAGIHLPELEDYCNYLEDEVGSEDIQDSAIQAFSFPRLKATISHEIAHWVDDTEHNFYLSTKADSGQIYTKYSEAFYAPFEIQALIHSVANMKKDNEDVWNQLYWEDVLEYDPNLGDMWYGDEVFRKLLRKRLYRENLIGTQMEDLKEEP